MSIEFEDTAEGISRRLKIEQKVTLFGTYVLAASADIAALSPNDTEYVAIPSGGIFAIGLIATAIDIYKQRRSHYFSPDDDPEEMDFEPIAEVIELSNRKVPPELEDIAA